MADFTQPLLQLMSNRNVDPAGARRLQEASAQSMRIGRETSALELLREVAPPLPTGLPSLDAALDGGLPPGCLTELCGPAGSGKSQLCTQLAVRAAAELGWTVLLLDTELRFPPSRFQNLARALVPAAAAAAASQRCFVLSAPQEEDFVSFTSPQGLQEMLKHFRPHLLIIDSLAAPFRLASDPAHRSAALAQLAARLKSLAARWGLVVVAVNQVCGDARAGGVIPALGNTWSHCVTHRLLMREEPSKGRILTVEKSSSAARSELCFEIRTEGVVEVCAAE